MRIADARIKLVVRIGYRRWALRGGDIGDTIARKAPPGLIGLAVAGAWRNDRRLNSEGWQHGSVPF